MIEEGWKEQNWVMIQNCHLSPSWMEKLEIIIKELAFEKTTKNFKLILTSEPFENFPHSILATSLKITIIPPSGIKSLVKEAHKHITSQERYARQLETLESPLVYTKRSSTQQSELSTQPQIDHPTVFKQLLFCLCFFNAVVNERKKFGRHFSNEM